MNLGLRDRGRSFEEIEIAAAVRLGDVARVEVTVAARVGDFARLPRRTAAREFLVRDAQRQPARRYVELDDVAVPNEGKRTADERLGRHMENARAVRRPPHA